MAAGDLDTSFDGNGKKAISFGGTDIAHAVLVQGDGRIVVAGGGSAANAFCVARLRPDGRLDTSFGSGGKRRISFGGQQESAFGAALQPDGRIVLVGDSDFRAAVARLDPDGSLDTTFAGDGRRLFSWGPISRAMRVIVLPNGKLLLGGFSGPEGGNMQVARMNAGGTFDATFGTGGKAAVDFGGDDFGLAMARQRNGRILLAGHSTVAGAIVARLRAGGALDPDFGDGGRLTLGGNGTLRAVVVQPDRKIVVAGNVGGLAMMTVTRLQPSGFPDPAFGGDGTVTIDIGALSDIANAALIQPDGKIVVVGVTAGGLAVVRLNADGSPDAGFGTAGTTIVDFGAATFGNAVARQADGRIVVAGQRTGSDDFAVARVLD